MAPGPDDATADPNDTLIGSNDQAEATRLAWLRSQGLIDEHVHGPLLASPQGLSQVLEHLVIANQLDHDQEARLLAITAESQLIGPWVTEALLGRGAMGEVYRAVDILSGQRAALKVIRHASSDSDQIRRRFARECQLLSGIEHPAICRTLSWDVESTRPWLAMAYVPGIGLDLWVRQHQALPETVALHIILQIAKGLAHVEAEIGIVHRDIKPGNIIVQVDDPAVYPAPDDRFPAILIDFGLAKDLDADGAMTLAGATMGTPAYMATEQMTDAGAIDERADIYALGATLYHLLTGKAPFAGNDALEVLQQRADCQQPDPAALVPGIAATTRELVLCAMAPDREQRFLSHQSFIRALRRALQHHESAGTDRLLRKPLTTTHTQHHQAGEPTRQRSESTIHPRNQPKTNTQAVAARITRTYERRVSSGRVTRTSGSFQQSSGSASTKIQQLPPPQPEHPTTGSEPEFLPHEAAADQPPASASEENVEARGTDALRRIMSDRHQQRTSARLMRRREEECTSAVIRAQKELDQPVADNLLAGLPWPILFISLLILIAIALGLLGR